MKTCKLPLVALFCALSAVPLGVAAAEDFTITVPVSVSNLRAEATGVNVTCLAGIAPISSDTNASIGYSGRVSAGAPDAAGNLTSNVVVKFNARTGQDPARATHYWCFLMIVGPGGGAHLPISSDTTGNFAWATAKSGTTLIKEVRGTLPQ